jgi:hypothetical protein
MPRTKTTKDNQYGIYEWFDYLTKYFLPTAPMWSNMLLGNSKWSNSSKNFRLFQ